MQGAMDLGVLDYITIGSNLDERPCARCCLAGGVNAGLDRTFPGAAMVINFIMAMGCNGSDFWLRAAKILKSNSRKLQGSGLDSPCASHGESPEAVSQQLA